MSSDVEPLDPETWLHRLSKLAKALASNPDADIEPFVRQAWTLCRLVPAPLKDYIVACEETHVEQLLEAGSFESAAMQIPAHPLGLSIVRAPGARTVMATVAFGANPAIAGIGKSEQLGRALLQAWANCMVTVGERARSDDVTHRDRHRSRSGSHQNSTAH